MCVDVRRLLFVVCWYVACCCWCLGLFGVRRLLAFVNVCRCQCALCGVNCLVRVAVVVEGFCLTSCAVCCALCVVVCC